MLRLPGELKPLPTSLAVSVLSLLARHGDTADEDEAKNLVCIDRGFVTSDSEL